jgi:hypothetical protein
MMQGATFGGPNVAALAQGRCPSCGGSSVVVTFDPAKIKARNAALASSPVELTKGPAIKPAISFPYLSSLTLSPGEEMASWVSGGKPGAFEIVIASMSSGSQVARFEHPAHKYPPECLFVGNDRLLVSTHLTDELKQVNLALLDVGNGQKVTEIDVPDCYFTNPCVRHDTKTIVAKKDTNNLIVVEADGDNLAYRTIETSQIYSPGPRFGPDGKIYVIVHSLYRIEGDKKVRVMDGDNCICFDPAGKVYCGGGYSDRSGDSALHVADLNSGTTFDVSWGREPINVIELAGDDHLLIANIVSEIQAGRYPNAIITLFSLGDRKKKWTIEIRDLKPWHKPVLLSAPNDRWALIQTGKLLKRISLRDGSVIQTFSKQPQEVIEANWLPSKKIMCLARQLARDTGGALELYKMA